ncbi:MAG TPA: DNA-processing protein DprA, partial [Longimicrobiaceae bacterium]|nr:DNA-processing protein DprA [Longimicrobiaceae bacterium]
RRAVRTLARLGAVGLIPDDPAYPPAFRFLDSVPYPLFTAGDLTALRLPGIAVVGTRTPTRYGAEVARRLSAELSAGGFAIVSGLARGIDTAAHEGAVEADGIPVGVLGHGIEQVYPPENRQLFARVRERGLLITEYPPGETPKPGNFPRRNRLITALSEAVLVVEMGHKSGAQHTVAYALDQGKEVLAVPGPIGSPRSEGTNQLIREGARLVTSAWDIVEELRGVGHPRAGADVPMRHPPPAPPPSREAPNPPTLPLLTATEEKVMTAIGAQPVHVDILARQAGLPSSRMLATLLELELRGVIAALPGKRFARRS